MDIRIIIKINELIQIQCTGSSNDLASKLELSVRTVYNYLEFMKTELNAPIQYSNSKKSYCYEGEFRLCF